MASKVFRLSVPAGAPEKWVVFGDDGSGWRTSPRRGDATVVQAEVAGTLAFLLVQVGGFSVVMQEHDEQPAEKERVVQDVLAAQLSMIAGQRARDDVQIRIALALEEIARLIVATGQ